MHTGAPGALMGKDREFLRLQIDFLENAVKALNEKIKNTRALLANLDKSRIPPTKDQDHAH